MSFNPEVKYCNEKLVVFDVFIDTVYLMSSRNLTLFWVLLKLGFSRIFSRLVELPVCIVDSIRNFQTLGFCGLLRIYMFQRTLWSKLPVFVCIDDNNQWYLARRACDVKLINKYRDLKYPNIKLN